MFYGYSLVLEEGLIDVRKVVVGHDAIRDGLTLNGARLFSRASIDLKLDKSLGLARNHIAILH